MADALPALLRLVPAGCWVLDEGDLLLTDLTIVASGLDAVDVGMEDLRAELHPQTSDVLLARWEGLYQLRAASFTTTERQARLVARVQLIPTFTPTAIEDAVEAFGGVAATLLEPGPFRCDDPDSVCDDVNDVIDGAFVFVLDFAWADADAASLRRAELMGVVRLMQPAHTVARLRFDDFHADDPYSLTDLDLLGA